METKAVLTGVFNKIINCEPKQESNCVVHLRTTMWSDKRGLHVKKSLTFLRKQCVGFNVLEEDTSEAGAEGVIPKITNSCECKNGVYIVQTCNESEDLETGYLDDYDYRLVPFEKVND